MPIPALIGGGTGIWWGGLWCCPIHERWHVPYGPTGGLVVEPGDVVMLSHREHKRIIFAVFRRGLERVMPIGEVYLSDADLLRLQQRALAELRNRQLADDE